MQKNLLFFIALLSSSIVIAQPTSWVAKGVGGGGGVFSPSISPYNGNTLFMACDMSQMFQSTNFGQSWSIFNFLQLPGNRNTEVQYTSLSNKLFAIKKPSNSYIPVKSYDGGVNWVAASNPCVNSAYQYFSSFYDTNQVVISDASHVYFTNSENTNSYTTVLNYPFGGAQKYGSHLAGVYFENKDTVYICSHDSLIYTFDGGVKWSSAKAGTTGIPANEHIISFKGAKQGGKWVFYAVTMQANFISAIYKTYPEDYPKYKGLYKLSQGKNNWDTLKLPATSDKGYILGLSKNDTSVVYVAGNSNSAGNSFGAVFKSTDAGKTFADIFITAAQNANNSNIVTGWMGKQAVSTSKFSWNGLTFISGFTVDPNNSSRIVCADKMGVHTSIDKGLNWQQAYTDENYDNPAGTLISQSSPYKTSGLETTVSYWLTWTSASNIFASYNDIVARRSTDGGNVWSFDIYGLDSTKINDVNMIAVDKTNGKMYAACGEMPGSNGDYSDVRVTTARGRIAVSSDNGVNWTSLKSFGHAVTSVALDPLSKTNGMYATVIDTRHGIGGIYYCSDVINSTVWTKKNSPARTQGRPTQIVALNDGNLIAVFGPRDTSNSNTPSYKYTDSSGVFYSIDGGLTWSDNNLSNMKQTTVSVEIDSNDPTQKTWLAFGNNGASGGVFKTTDRGSTWTQVYNSPAISGTFHPLLSNEMYICTATNGLLYVPNTTVSSYNSATVVNSYPFRAPQSVFFNPYNANEVWVTSFGNGLMKGTTNLIITSSQDNKKEDLNISLYPNPVSNELNFSEAISSFSILNTFGQVVYETNKSTKSIATQNFADGLYFVKGVNFTIKFIVKH